MKILCVYSPCGPSYVRTGWGRVFAAMGHQFYFWRPDIKPAFDIFSQFEPDMFIGTTYEIDRALFKCIAARPKMKVALYASAWGPLVDKVDLSSYPIVTAKQEEQQTIERLKGETGRPDYVFIHVTNKYLDGTMGHWRRAGVEPYGILNAADTFDYMGGVREENLACDIAFVGGYWKYKARNLDKYMIPLVDSRSSYKVKLFGNQPWPVAQYLGELETARVKNLFVSATVCPSVSEPHSTDLGWDVIERPFKVLSSGGFCVADYVDEAREIFTENELPMAKTPERFRQLIDHFIANPGSRDHFMANGKAKVLAKHTYFDRVHQMLQCFGMHDEAARCLEVKNDRVKA